MTLVTDEPIEQNRRDAEISLLEAMYPETLQWNSRREELTYQTGKGTTLVLRVSNDYPEDSRPVLLAATGSDKTDLRDLTRNRIDKLDLHPNEEVLDTILQDFEAVADSLSSTSTTADVPGTKKTGNGTAQTQTFKTTIIWLHHLLNTNKRKHALNPTMASSAVTGITKPGYPGVLIFSGEASSVDAHCAELKNQRWQAFQVRYEEIVQKPWSFSHKSGIVEVETMSHVTQNILDPGNRDLFLQAIGVK